MKTKQIKEEPDKITDEDVVEPKTRGRKKATDGHDDDKQKPTQDELKTTKEPKKNLGKPKTVVRRRPLGIRKALRSKRVIFVPETVKNAIKGKRRGRRPVVSSEPGNSQEKETVPLIPASEIKKEPIEETSSSRSSSPKTAGRRQRLTSDMVMMKSVLGDSPSSLVLGPRTSPYSMRSERSNSPSIIETKNLRSGKPRKAKNNLLNEVVMKEQKKRRRLLSDSKSADTGEATEDCKKLKRGRSCSRDGSEISKCSDITESDISLGETLNESDSKELNKKLDKPKTELDLDIENSIQISTIQKVPLNIESKLPEHKIETESNSNVNRKKKLSLKRSTSLDSDNNNSNRQILEKLNTADLEEKLLLKTENDTLFEARSSILTSMSKTFNSKEMSKNIRRARRGRKVAAASRPNPNQAATAKSGDSNVIAALPPIEATDEKPETQETLAKEIDDLIFNLDQNIDKDVDAVTNTAVSESVNNVEQLQTKSVSKFYGLSKPLGDNNSIIISDTGKDGKETGKEKDVIVISSDNTPIKNDDSENIRLHYGDELVDKQIEKPKHEITYKCAPTVASIDKLMDRLKEFEELDKRRQRQEVEKSNDNNKSVMVTNDVVLIPKSGADIKPLKDIQSAMSPEKPIEKENVLSCFENNSAISIVKRDQVRKSIDVDLTNSVTLIKRNSARKESTSTKEDAISIFEKSLGKDVTLTEIRKSVDKVPPTTTLVDLHQFATLLPNSTNLSNVVLDSQTISITPRLISDSKNCNDVQITKRKSLESNTRKSSESGTETEEKMATIEKIKSPLPQIKPTPILITPLPVSVKSPETIKTMETEALPAPTEITKQTEDLSMEIGVFTEDIVKIDEPLPQQDIMENVSEEVNKQMKQATILEDIKVLKELVTLESTSEIPEESKVVAKEERPSSSLEVVENKAIENAETKTVKTIAKTKTTRTSAELTKVTPKIETRKSIERKSVDRKSTERRSLEMQAGPSNLITETPENQKNKENVLRTLGLLTLKAAKEAKIEKLKEKERLYGPGMVNSKNKKSGDYTGTLKTVIKLNRTSDREKKKYRSPLKITFQKSKNRSGKPEVGEATAEEEYYTIERREVGAGTITDDTEAVPEPTESKDTPNLVIPEKASSFSIHPGRLCMDQCFYCGGKFGLFDTPCHIAQMKSSERQKKVLDNEEKLTIDSCLCDACYRHVDRRANCPSYRKRPVAKAPQETNPPQLPSPPLPASSSQPDKSLSPPLEEESEEEPPPTLASGRPAICHTEGCTAPADRSIRRKWLIKMRSSVNKVLKLECDYPGLHTIPLCLEHHRLLAPLMTCSLCRCSLTKHHNLHVIHHGVEEVTAAVHAAGVPAILGEKPVLCKVCRYYVTLLQRPGSAPPADYAYTRKLLQIYNIEVPPGPENQVDEMSIQEDSFRQADKQKRRTKSKNKQRKSNEPEKTDSETVNNEKSIRVLESPPEKERTPDDDESKKNDLEEDIESLISSNKIPVPGANKESIQSGEGHDEMLQDMEAPLLPIDKQTELQYLLQKQNNPAQFLKNTTNLTQKQKNILKIQNLSGVQKPGQQQRIIDKNAKRIQKIGLNFIAQKDKTTSPELDMSEAERSKEGVVLKNISLNDECTIESIPNKRQADINQLKNKWQMTESFTQVKKNLSELSKKLTVEKEPKKSNEVKYSNPVKRLETNPSISVRELFPGEEEMNLQCNVEFNNVKGVTPEGWEKCNTMIQYDVETKRLWNELQRPYGNQSSFLRHLILLEKYFRSGDLVLSHSASPTAANYSDSVQSRLRAYDNTVTDAPRRSEPAISLIEFRKKPSINGKSLLKSNQAESDNTKKVMPPPPGVMSKPRSKDKAKSKPLPPELIAINTPKKPMQNVLHNIQQLVKGVTASDPTEVAAAPLPPPKVDTVKEKKDPPKLDGVKKTKTTSKPWRPTLMPITQENLAKVGREPTQVAVDGRKLRSLVQVMSSGKQYHITLQDYNKMCIMRMEKLQQQEKEIKTKRLSEETSSIVTEIQPSQMLGNGGTLLQNIDKDSTDNALSQIGTNAATILKNVGLKNITIAPITPKTATVTSQTITSPVVSSPSLLVTSTPLKMPQLAGVSITSEPLTSSPITPPTMMMMPKIPKSLTVIPQTISVPQSLIVSSGPTPSQASHENRP